MNTESIIFTPNYETNGFKVDFPEGSLIEAMEPNIRYNFIKGLSKDQLFKLCPNKESRQRLGKTLKECLDDLQITKEQKETDLKEFYEFMKEFNETHKEE